MRPLLSALLLACACGPVSPEIRLHRDGMRADLFGAACPDGSKHVDVIGRPAIGVYRVRCEDGSDWIVRDARAVEE